MTPWRKYNLVRSQSLLQQTSGNENGQRAEYVPVGTSDTAGYRIFALSSTNGQVRPLSYRTLDEERPVIFRSSDIIVTSKPPLPPPVSYSGQRRGGSLRRLRSGGLNHPSSVPEESAEEVNGNGGEPRVKPSTTRRRIPLDLLDRLPESMVDTEPEERHRRTSGPQRVTVRVRPPERSSNGGIRTPPLPEPPLDNLEEPLPPPPPPLEFCLSEEDNEDGRLRSQHQKPEIVTSEESVLCQESPRGTVFGLVSTPTLTRRGPQTPLDNKTEDYDEDVFFDNDNSFPSKNFLNNNNNVKWHNGLGQFPNNKYVSPLRGTRPYNLKTGVTVINFGSIGEKNHQGLNKKNSGECFNTNVKVHSVQPKAYDLTGVNETVNPQLRASFYRTMLTEVQSPRPTKTAVVRSTSQQPLLNKTETPVKLEARTSLPGNLTDKRHVNKRGPVIRNVVPWSPDESPEVMEAMEHLDKSIEEGEVSSTDGSDTAVKVPNIVPKPTANGQPESAHETDNLIEEVLFPGPNKRSYFSLSMAEQRDNAVQGNCVKQGDADSTNGSIDGAVVPKLSGGESENEEMVSGTSTPNKKANYFVVVAIDFGTTYSGYAFSFVRDPDKIHMMRKWEGGDPGVLNQKTPTTLLLTAEGLFHSFGFAARDFYHNLEPEEAKKWLFFEKFKMTLHHSEDLCRDTIIKAANGKSQAAVVVFAHALRYFKEHALQELSDQSATRILNEDVRWVVTVPAIWRQPAKQFMRTASYEAGIASPETADQLLIALEPEAASIYCRQLRLHQLVPESPPLFKLLTRKPLNEVNDVNSKPVVAPVKGTRYMVVDCGGGTVDITVHELLDDGGSLKELHKAVGGPHGSVGVDVEFEKLLSDIFGADFLEQFKTRRSVGFIDLMVAFEARKRNASPYNIMPLNVSLPFSFIDHYKKTKGNSVEHAIKKYGNKEVTWSSQGMLRLEPALMNRLFQSTVQSIKQCIADVLASPQVNGVTYLFLVGGFAESQILQREIRDAFAAYVRVIIPQGVSLAILTGAVLFGLDPTVVNIRRSRLTYGVGVLNRFIHGVHPQEKLVVKDDIEWCADIFDKFVLADQSVGLGEAVIRSYTPAKLGQTCTILHIYCSERHEAKFITDEGVHRCGSLILDLADTKYANQVPRRREIQTRMIFGDTEIKVTALDVSTGKCVRAEIDFLNQ